MNPWKIIGWIVLALLVLMLWSCGTSFSRRSAERAAPPAPESQAQHAVRVVTVECTSRGRDLAEVTVINAGATTIEYAKAFAQFKDKAGNVVSARDSYFTPTSIPPGATASARVYSNGSGADTCELATIQDGDGLAVNMQ